jgi:hypothetical protein
MRPFVTLAARLLFLVLVTGVQLPSAWSQDSCSQVPQPCTGDGKCVNCGITCLNCPQAKMQRPDCFTVEKARNVLAEKSCSFMCATPTPTPCMPVACDGTEAPRAFDINGDCRVTVEDAREVYSYLDLRKLDLDQEFDVTYDANGSGTVTSLDALVIINFLRGHQCLPTPTPIPTQTPTPIPAGACLTNNNETRLTSAGVLEYYFDGKKPGRWREASALTGLSWANGGTAKSYGTAQSTLDFNLCPKIGFYERGHSLTRTIHLVAQEDGDYHLTVHRIRNRSESYGVLIRYWFDGSQVEFTRGAIPYRGNWFVDFNLHQDYNLECSYRRDRNKPWRCSWTTSKLTAIDCNRWHHSRIRNGCNEIN